MTPSELNQHNNAVADSLYRRELRRAFLLRVGTRAAYIIIGAACAMIAMLIAKITT